MNKGFSLIETIVYVSLLAIIIIGVFSSLMSSIYTKKPLITKDDYELLIENFHE